MAFIKFKDDYQKGRTIINLCGIKISVINKKLVARPDYSKAISKIREKHSRKEKIKVGFLVSENCKWNAESLYKLLEENENFEPIILVTLYTSRHTKQDMTKTSVEDNYDFFAKQGKRVVKAYDEENEKYLDIKDFDIDVLFYQQPWGIDYSQSVDVVSQHCLCCYYAYGITVFDSPIDIRPFHERLYNYFVPNEETAKGLKKYKINKFDNFSIVGYPKLDIYNNLEKIEHDKKTIIYAPHHSYCRRLRLGTFPKTGLKMLEFAKKHPEYNWIFKPHPDLKEVLYKDKKYGPEFAEKYYEEWAKVGKVYCKGNYFELFMASDLLITDCSAFLLEYMPTSNPIIRLDRWDSTKLSDVGKKIIKGIYQVYSFKEFESVFKKLEKVEKDELFDKRKEITETILRKTPNSCANIVKVLEKLFNKTDETN